MVERYRPSIETKKVEKLFDITEQDTKAVEAAMRDSEQQTALKAIAAPAKRPKK